MQMEYDVVIIGAGLSGIGMACQLVQQNPNKTYTILERRQDLGGTWDLFRYPGIRSDSDVISFGYKYNPWKTDTVLATADKIKAYLRETAQSLVLIKKFVMALKLFQQIFQLKPTNGR
jgi:cation diffusion facilitator CzcD-associated flavoprotein CzcO